MPLEAIRWRRRGNAKPILDEMNLVERVEMEVAVTSKASL